MKRKRIILNRLINILLSVVLIGNIFSFTLPIATAAPLVTSINLAVDGDISEHAFGENDYESKYYKELNVEVTAFFADGTNRTVTNESNFSSTRESLLVTPEGIVTGHENTSGSILVTYQNKQAFLKVNSNWDFASNGYVLNVLEGPIYGDLSEYSVIFEDKQLENAVRLQLEKPIGTITELDMQQLTNLDASYQNIVSLTGLQFAVNLEELYLEGNQINDLFPVNYLTKLRKLSVGHNELTSLAPIADLLLLSELHAESNKLNSISDVKNLTNLSVLNVDRNGITDLTPLSNLTNLMELQLSHNQFSDIETLTKLRQLSWVNVIGNPLNESANPIIQQLETNGVVVDFQPYDTTPIIFEDSNLERALREELHISPPLRIGDLHGIHELNLNNKGITSLKGLEHATNLQYLYLSSNKITNFDPLGHLNQINWLDISRNPIRPESIELLQALELSGAYVSYDLNYDSTPIAFADSLLESSILQQYDLSYPITKGDLSKMDYLFFNNEGITNLKGLEYATNLQGISLSRNQLTGITELQNLAHLQYVDITRNPLNTIDGSEAKTIILGLENKGVEVAFDTNGYSEIVLFQDPFLENRIGEILDFPTPMTKRDLEGVNTLQLNGSFTNKITVLEGIENATNLSSLFLNDNQILDLSPLAGMGQLRKLHLRNNDIKNLAPLLQIPNLEYVDLRNNLFDASEGSAASEIIATLKQKGVVVDYQLRPDMVVKGIVLDGDREPSKYTYINVSGNGKTYRTMWSPTGEFNLKLSDGIYQVTGIALKSTMTETSPLTFSFEIKEEKLYVNGEQKERLEIQVPPVTVKGYVWNEDGNPLASANVSISSSKGWVNSMTDGAGAFSLRLADGEYTIHSVNYGINNESSKLNIPFVVNGGQLFINGVKKEQIDINLPTSNFKGTVVDVNGLPVTFAEMLVNKQTYGDFTIKTDIQGEFRHHLEDGLYILKSMIYKSEQIHIDQSFEIKDGKLIIDGVLQEQLNLVLPPVTLKGSLVDENGELINYTTISVYNNGTWVSLRTDLEGKFSFRLPDGIYNGVRVTFDGQEIHLPTSFEITNGILYVNGQPSDSILLKLPSITVRGILMDENGYTLDNWTVNVSGQNHGSAITNPDGVFNLRLEDGAFNLSTVSFEDQEVTVNTSFDVSGGKLHVNGELRDYLEVKLPPPALKGSVSDRFGNIIANAKLTVNGATKNYTIDVDSIGHFAYRLTNGNYNVSSISFDNYQETINLPFAIIDGKLYVNGTYQDTLTVNIIPENFKGSLTVGNGSIANAYFSIYNNGKWSSMYTDSNGRFAFRLVDGYYEWLYVSLSNGEGVSLQFPFQIIDGKMYVNGELKDQVEIKVLPVSLTGTVKDENGLVVAKADIQFEGNNRGYGVYTDAQGKFSYRLADGKYKVTRIILGNEITPQNLDFEILLGKLYVNGQLKEQLEFNLPPVSLKGTLIGENGAPVANGHVHISVNNRGFGVQTDTQGKFTFRLADGNYRIFHVNVGSEGISQNIPLDIVGGKLYVNGELKEQLDIKIQPVTLQGMLLNDKGQPVANARISIDSNTGRNSVYTDAQGIYKFRLADGIYRIASVEDSTGDIPFNLPFEMINGKLYVNGNQQDRLDLNLPPITFTGSIQYTDGTAIQDGYVYLYDYKNGHWYNSKLTSEGKFLGRFADGDYIIHKVKDILVNHRFSIVNGRMVVNELHVEAVNVKLTNVKRIEAILQENGNVLPYASIHVGFQNGIVQNGFNADSKGVASLYLQDGLYFVPSIWREGKHVPFTNPIFFEMREGKIFVKGVEQSSLIVEINQQSSDLTNIKGEIRDPNGPISNARVNLWSFSEQKNIYPWTDGNGLFQTAVRDGDYQLQQVYVNGQDIQFNIHVKVLNGKLYIDGIESPTILIELPVITLYGDLLHAGQPMTQATLFIRDSLGSQAIVKTDDHGQFKGRLKDGDYTIWSIIKDSVVGEQVSIGFSIIGGKMFKDGKELASLTVSIGKVDNPAADVEADANALEVGFADGDSIGFVTKNIILPVSGEKGSVISWTSSHPEMISADGFVTRPAAGTGDKEVLLKAKVLKGTVSIIKEFVLTVKEEPGVKDVTPPTLEIDILGGTYQSIQTVSITASESAVIYYTVDGSEPTTESLVYTGPLTIDQSLTLKYFTIDLSGNASEVYTQVYTLELGPTGWIEDNNENVRYTGTWTDFESSSYSGNSYRFGGGRQNSVELTFYGSGIRWIAATSEKHGLADVYIDDQLVGEVNLYSEELMYQQIMFEMDGLTKGLHTIKIVKKNEKGDPKGKDTNINVDAFEVLP
jgi:Leucine-rich repeat (LRR) protein